MPDADINNQDLKALFDRRSADGDCAVDEIARAEPYPFAGDDRALDEIGRDVEPGMRGFGSNRPLVRTLRQPAHVRTRQ
jgi:hypothetical protein